METTTLRRDPELRYYYPVWYHHHGGKMRLEMLDREKGILIISGSAAKVTILRASQLYPDNPEWFVDWQVVQCRPEGEGVLGRSCFTSKDIEAALGLSEHFCKLGNWLIHDFGADSASQRKFIRWKNFLNIPCPGTGHDGDPNVSIELSEEIQGAVRMLIA